MLPYCFLLGGMCMSEFIWGYILFYLDLLGKIQCTCEQSQDSNIHVEWYNDSNTNFVYET